MAREQIKRITSIGGQALIEGIMMRGPQKSCIAVRHKTDGILLEELELHPIKEKYPALGWPFLRGIVTFVESLRIGYQALQISIEKSGYEEEEGEPSKFDQWLERKFGDKINSAIMVVSSVLGVLLAIALFFFLPTLIFNGLLEWAGEGLSVWRALIEGVMRILIFLGYVVLCSCMKDIHRVFQYHGAEHKTIFCYESEEELTVENARKHSRFHPRCGTSFMVIMIVLGIVVGFFIPFSNPFLRTIVKLLCIPIIVGIGYELLKICGRYDNLATRILAAPGKWVQRITTKEPDDEMLEVAIAALKEVIPENGEDLICSTRSKNSI